MAHGEHTAHAGGGAAVTAPSRYLPNAPTPAGHPQQQGEPRTLSGRPPTAHLRQQEEEEPGLEPGPPRRHPSPTAPPPAFVSARARPGPFRTGYLATRPGSPAPLPAASQWVFIREATSLLAAANEMANVGGGGGGGGGGAGKMAVRRGLRRHRGCRAAAPLAPRSSVAASG